MMCVIKNKACVSYELALIHKPTDSIKVYIPFNNYILIFHNLQEKG